MPQIIINNGIILTNSQSNLIPLIETISKKKYININNIKYLLDKGTLVILVSNIDSNLEQFNIEEEIDLITQNQFLLHNGDWWVSLKEDSSLKKDLILNHKYKVLNIEIEEEIIVEDIDIKKED